MNPADSDSPTRDDDDDGPANNTEEEDRIRHIAVAKLCSMLGRRQPEINHSSIEAWVEAMRQPGARPPMMFLDDYGRYDFLYRILALRLYGSYRPHLK
ncbi:hypothetical protein HFD88_006835 [Aspergillus terreus]|nr:hypothetical protein HFD88_006835 [Aspergillus terreus]